MATAMQDEATASKSREQSVAEKKLNTIIGLKLKKSDGDLVVYAEICAEEAEERVKMADPDHWCFGVSVAVRGRWAAALLSRVSMDDFPKTKKLLCTYIADGWLGCRKREDEKFFADILREWPATETKEAADVVRHMIEFRDDPANRNGMDARLTRFFSESPDPRGSGDEIYRTVFKAIGRYIEVQELVLLGRALEVLRGSLTYTLRDFVKNALGR